MNLLLASTLQSTFAAAQPRFPKPLAQCRVVCIPTAANVYEKDKRAWLDEEMDVVRRAGATLDVFDITGKNVKQVRDKLTAADILYVTGGNTYYLLEQMQKCGLASALPAFFQHGGLYVGASAGAIVACPYIDFIGTMDNPGLAHLNSSKGLNLVPFLVMPHLDHPKYATLARTLLTEIPATETVIALRDNQALWVSNNAVELIQA